MVSNFELFKNIDDLCLEIFNLCNKKDVEVSVDFDDDNFVKMEFYDEVRDLTEYYRLSYSQYCYLYNNYFEKKYFKEKEKNWYLYGF